LTLKFLSFWESGIRTMFLEMRLKQEHFPKISQSKEIAIKISQLPKASETHKRITYHTWCWSCMHCSRWECDIFPCYTSFEREISRYQWSRYCWMCVTGSSVRCLFFTSLGVNAFQVFSFMLLELRILRWCKEEWIRSLLKMLGIHVLFLAHLYIC